MFKVVNAGTCNDVIATICAVVNAAISVVSITCTCIDVKYNICNVVSAIICAVVSAIICAVDK